MATAATAFVILPAGAFEEADVVPKKSPAKSEGKRLPGPRRERMKAPSAKVKGKAELGGKEGTAAWGDLRVELSDNGNIGVFTEGEGVIPSFDVKLTCQPEAKKRKPCGPPFFNKKDAFVRLGLSKSGYLFILGSIEERSWVAGYSIERQGSNAIIHLDTTRWEKGNYRLWATVDSSGNVFETNEKNNSAGPVTLTVIPGGTVFKPSTPQTERKRKQTGNRERKGAPVE